MSILKDFVLSPLAGGIGWALLHSLWEGALITAALATVLFSVRSARIRYAAACGAMLLMVATFSITLLSVMPQQTQSPLSRMEPVFRASNAAAGGDSSSSDLGLAPIVPWLTPFWIAGVSLIYLRRVASCIAVQKLRRRGVCSVPEPWQDKLAQLSARLHLSRPTQLLESSLADVPAVLGHFRPVILLPVGLLAGLSPAQVEAILLHELAHVRRYDYLVNILQRLIEGLFFYHPAIWWISRVIRAERESCCDDLAVSISGNAHEYASALAAVERRRQTVLEPALAATGGSLVKRIRRVLYPTKPGPWAPFLAATVFVLVAAASLAAWKSETPQPESRDMQNQGETSSAYSKWLNEDVVYIIDDEERAAFLQLTSDADRDKFIEQFWAKRDPSPGTPTNEFKIEHYRRIMYANQHFGTASGTPGWQTDRGHIYVVYGRPVEIIFHPAGAQGVYDSHPFEVWRYEHLKDGSTGSFTFVDRSGLGDYQLAPPPLPPPPPGASESVGGSVRVRPRPTRDTEVSGQAATRVTSGAEPSATESSAPCSGMTTDSSGRQVPLRVRISERVAEGLLLEKVEPVYPSLAQQARIQGRVVLRAIIGCDGTVQNLHPISGHPMLTPAAIEAVKDWRYRPYLLNGNTVEVETTVTVNFELR